MVITKHTNMFRNKLAEKKEYKRKYIKTWSKQNKLNIYDQKKNIIYCFNQTSKFGQIKNNKYGQKINKVAT